MKKYLILIIFVASLFALRTGKITLTKGANVRNAPSLNAKIIDTVKKGTIIEYTDTIGYFYLKVIKGVDKKHTSDHIGKEGWMWTERVKDNFVIIEGCTLRSSPEKRPDTTPEDTSDDHNFIAKVKKNATVKVSKIKVYWYYKASHGWISGYCTR